MRIATFVTTATLAMVSTITFAQNVTYDFDRAADFSQFKRYAWVRGTTLTDDLNHKRVMNAVDAQLALKGLTEVGRGENPDVLVAYHAAFDRNLQITGFASGWGGYRFAGTRTGTARAEQIMVGTLAVDVMDANSRTIVWRGTATKDIDVNANAEKRDKNIRKAAEKLFKNYPPKSK